MDWQNCSAYFEELPDPFLRSLFLNCAFPWSPLASLHESIAKFFGVLASGNECKARRKLLYREDGTLLEGSYHTLESDILKEDFVDSELSIFIGAGTFLESGATIKNHTIVSRDCEIRQGAYLRGDAYIGAQSVVGHATEVKNSIFLQHVEAGHFAYIGDSIIGSYVNLGAGTKISNLQFRKLKEKRREIFPEIPFAYDNKKIETGLSKFGAIVGDGCETGCNSVLCPFVLLEPECWIMPNCCVFKGVYKRRTILRQQRIESR